MTEHYNYDLGWRVARGQQLAHWYRSSNTSKLAIAHCGWMSSKSDLEERATADHCGYYQAVEDMRQDDESILAPA